MGESNTQAKDENIYTQQEIDKIITSCEQYRESLIKYCQQFFGYEYEYAEDCVQNAYVALVENLSRGIEIRNYNAWLFKVTMYYKNKALKDKIKRNEYTFKNTDEKYKVIDDNLIYENDYIEDMVSDKIISERASSILLSLNDKEKELYLSHYIRNKNFKEISTDMGISHNAARQRHVGLKKKIIKMVKKYD